MEKKPRIARYARFSFSTPPFQRRVFDRGGSSAWLRARSRRKIRGYFSRVTKIFKELLEEGLHLFTKIRKNMKNKLISIENKILLKARTIIETIFDIMKNILNIDHTRHRSPDNALTHLLAGISAYQFLDHKPSISNNKPAIEFLPKIS